MPETQSYDVDSLDLEAIRVAIEVRKSKLFQDENGELRLPEYDGSDLDGAVLAEICRSWLDVALNESVYSARKSILEES